MIEPRYTNRQSMENEGFFPIFDMFGLYSSIMKLIHTHTKEKLDVFYRTVIQNNLYRFIHQFSGYLTVKPSRDCWLSFTPDVSVDMFIKMYPCLRDKSMDEFRKDMCESLVNSHELLHNKVYDEMIEVQDPFRYPGFVLTEVFHQFELYVREDCIRIFDRYTCQLKVEIGGINTKAFYIHLDGHGEPFRFMPFKECGLTERIRGEVGIHFFQDKHYTSTVYNDTHYFEILSADSCPFIQIQVWTRNRYFVETFYIDYPFIPTRINRGYLECSVKINENQFRLIRVDLNEPSKKGLCILASKTPTVILRHIAEFLFYK